MVTIEQKLLLFSRLLNQSMNQTFQGELKSLEKKYKEKIQEIKETVDSEANEIVEKAKKNYEIKKNQNISKSKIKLKKETMLLKEKYYNLFINKLKIKLNSFVESKGYEKYLSDIIMDLNNELFSNNNVMVYLTKFDYDKYGKFIKENIKKTFNSNCSFTCLNTIIGGLIIENSEKNFRVDMTVDSILEENKLFIMQALFNALEAGELND
jgi:V/A-type H+-transporting ATPase subunit E